MDNCIIHDSFNSLVQLMPVAIIIATIIPFIGLMIISQPFSFHDFLPLFLYFFVIPTSPFIFLNVFSLTCFLSCLSPW